MRAPSEKAAYWFVCLTSLIASIAGIVYAVASNHVADGGRGGAVGTALALGFMFLNRDYGTKLYDLLTKHNPGLREEIQTWLDSLRGQTTAPVSESPNDIDKRIAKIESKINALVRAISVDAEGQKLQSRFLAGTTAFATIIWGFGDWIAQWIIDHHH